MNAPWYFAAANQAGGLGLFPDVVSGTPGFRDPALNDAEHDALLALMRWTEEGKGPDKIVATKWHNDTSQDKVLRQRPLCPYPKRARYSGHGDPDHAKNWHCSL